MADIPPNTEFEKPRTTLQDSLSLVRRIREDNKDQVASLNDQELADLVHQQTGDQRLLPIAHSSALSRGIAKTDRFVRDLGQSAEESIVDENSGMPRRVAGRAINNVIGSSPEMLLMYLGGRLGGVASGVATGTGAAYNYAKEKAQSGNEKAALGQAGSFVLSSLGGAQGSQRARAMASRSRIAPNPALGQTLATNAPSLLSRQGLKEFGAGVAGSTVGQMPGDYLGMVTQPGETASLKKFREDPVNMYAYLLGQPVAGAVMDAASEGYGAHRARKEKARHDAPELNDLIAENTADELARLNAVPVAERSEIAKARMRDLSTRLAQMDEKIVAEKMKQTPTPQEFASMPEVPSTLHEQVRSLNKQKRAVVAIPKGTELPATEAWDQGFMTHEGSDGTTFLYDERKTNPEQIENAIKTNTVGNLLGYGVPTVPNGPANELVVMRNRKGVEKSAVVTDAASKQSIIDALTKQADAEDTVGVEPMSKVLEWRMKNKGLQKLFSLERSQPDAEGEVHFANTVLDMFNKSMTPRIRGMREKGPRFQTDAEGNINGKGLLAAVKQWAPAELFHHYKEQGIEQFLGPSEHVYTVQQPQTIEGRTIPGYTQIDPIKENGRGEPLTKQELAALPKPPPDLATGQYVRRGDQWVPVKDTLTVPNKVPAAAFSDWLRKNTPNVEVRKLEPRNTSQLETNRAHAQHELETRGYELQEQMDGSIGIVGANVESLPNDVRRLLDNLNMAHGQIEGTVDTGRGDAATGKYGVEPINVSEMDRPVDLLVRAPSPNYDAFVNKNEPANGRTNDLLYEGPHFGKSDKNVLASIRGYFHKLATGESAFFPFEIQSDWGQKLSKAKEALEDKTRGAMRGFGEQQTIKDLSHPLVEHYETLALKTAIQHARANGATKMVLPDSKTAMMIEGHDRNAPTNYTQTGEPVKINEVRNYGWHNPLPKDWKWHNKDQRIAEDKKGQLYRIDSVEVRNKPAGNYKENPGIGSGIYNVEDFAYPVKQKIEMPSQAKGMTAHYDESIPAIARRLTGDRGTPVNLGDFTARGASSAFGGKKDITGRVYDITNPSPEVKKLFSMYDASEQLGYVRNIEKTAEDITQGKRPPEEFTAKSFLDRAIAGDQRVKTDPLVNFLNTIKGTRGKLEEQTMPQKKGMTTKAFLNPNNNDIAVNRYYKFTVENAFKTLAHELTHGAVMDMKYADPRAFEYLTKYTKDLSYEGRKAIFDNLKEQLGLENFDTEYQAGGKFDPKDPNYDFQVAHEFSAGIMEAVAKAHIDSLSSPKWMQSLPQPVIKMLKRVMEFLKKHVGSQYPSLSHILEDNEAAHLNRVIDIMQKHVVDVENANIRSYLKIKNSDTFDPSTFVQNLPDRADKVRESVNATRGGDGALYSMMKDEAEKMGALPTKKKAGILEQNWLSPLFRTRTRPETADFFWALHNMRPAIQGEGNGYLAYLGQKPDGSLSRDQAFERWNKFMGGLRNPLPAALGGNPRRQKFIEAFSKINEENQNIREKSPNTQESDLIQKDQMVEKYGMTEEEAEYTQRIIKMSELVSTENLRKAQVVDGLAVSKLFYRQNKDQKISDVKAKVARITRVVNDFGAQRFEKEQYKRQLEEMAKVPDADPAVVQELTQRVAKLDEQEAAFKVLLDQNIRTEFGSQIPFQLGPDPFITHTSELMVRLAALRAHQQFITKDAGYAPMTRRGRFLLRVYDNTDMGKEFAKVKEFRGFETEKDAREYIAKQGLREDSFELMDKENFADRARVYSPDKLKVVRDQAKAQLDSLIADLTNDAGLSDPETRANLLEAYQNVQRGFSPLENEIKEVLAVRGDKFKERRHLVPGFDRNDFLPNIFEYMNYKTVAGNKAVARAEAELQMEHKDVEPELREQMQKETDYTLGSQKDWSDLRKLTFYYYLGASMRHIAQNAVQVPVNGISQMVADGHGLDSYGLFADGARLSAKYGWDGTTGDKTIDAMLKQAEKDGVSIATVLEAPLNEAVDIQNSIDSMHASTDGSIGFGDKLKFGGTQALKGMEKFLMSTSKAAERANRQTTFIASILASRKKGLSDPQAIYNKATQFTNYVNFVGDKANRPGFIVKHGQTPLHAPLVLWTALQSFTFNHLSQLYAFHKLGNQGSAADKRAFYTGVAHLLAFSGAMGFVGASTAEQIFEKMTGISLTTAIRKGIVQGMSTMFGGDDEDKKEQWAHTADRVADGVLYGLPAAMGVDSSQSLGLGAPFVRYQSGGPIQLKDVAGATYGMLDRVGTAVGDIASDPFNPQQWLTAGRHASPSFMTQALRTYDVMNAGTAVDANQQPIGDPLGIEGSAATALGFTPMQVAKERAFNSQVYKSTKRQTEDYELHTRNVAKLINEFQKSGDPAALTAASQEFSAYVDSVGGLQDRDAFIGSITDQLQQFRGKVTNPASVKGSQDRQSLEAAFPSVTSRYPSALSQSIDELEVAQLLGQDDVLARKMNSLPSSVRDKVLHDVLISVGLRPEQTSEVLQPGSVTHLGHGTGETPQPK